MITKILRATMWFIGAGIAIVFVLCLLEVFYGYGLTHPMWDQSYNWVPLVRSTLYISFVGGITMGMLDVKGAQHEDNNNFIGGHYVYHG